MIYTNNKQVGLSANEVNNLVTKLVESKQDKKIVFEGQEMLLTTALQRVNNAAVGKANIIDAETLPDTLTPNSQYWVKTYNGQTIDNGRYIILVDNLGTPHFMGESTSVPVTDIQINGNSIVDGATQIANIQTKTTIDDTATDNDIPSAKGVWNLVKSGGGGSGSNIEDVSNKVTIKLSGTFTVSDYKAFKLGNNLLCLNFKVIGKGGLSGAGYNIGTLKGLEDIGVVISSNIVGCSYSNSVTCNTYISSTNKGIYMNFASLVSNPTVFITYLIPINI